MDGFRGLRWIGTEPRHLDYENAQFLLVGEKSGLDKALQPAEDADSDEKQPIDEMEQLEHEDEERMKHLDETDAIFTDLEVSAKDYPKLLKSFDD